MAGTLDGLVDRYIQTVSEDYPTWATFLGLHERDGEFGDYSTDGIAEKRGHLEDLASELRTLPSDGMSRDELVDAALLGATLASALFEYDKVRPHVRRPAMYLQTALSGCNLLVSREFAPVVDRAGSLLSRLKAVPALLLHMEENIENPPRVFAAVGAEIAHGGAAFVRTTIPGIAEKVPGLASDLDTAASHAIESFERAAAHLSKLAEDADADFALGREGFEWMLRNDHMLDLDADGLEEIGREVLEETKSELARAAQEIDPDGTWEEIIDRLKNEHPEKGEVRETYASWMERSREFIRKEGLVRVPETEELEVVDTPVFIRSIIPYAAYLPPGPFETNQCGQFYVTPVNEELPPEEQERQLRGHGLQAIPATAVHEGYPGHHLQLVRANQCRRKLRRMTQSTVFCEGWALYCEDMMWEAGFYTDPRIRIFQLKDALWRAARVVVDVGLHVRGMSIDDGVDFMVNEAGLERVHAVAEVKRYAGSPTQPMSYTMGKRAILDIRRRREASDERFRLADFHNELLDLGNMPPLLAEVCLGLRDSKDVHAWTS
ncbi:MAG: DUF885 family protein [Candidatus Eisenbacteria bacterium]|nr:DUF885 family protein [Candidatus Eisenbacteria bacterium]